MGKHRGDTILKIHPNKINLIRADKVPKNIIAGGASN